MKSGRGAQGFTLVEVMIFLAVTAFVFVSALVVMGGQQQKTQFTQSMRDIDSKIKTVIDDVSTGYFPNSSSSVRCQNLGAGIAISLGGATNDQGTNKDCIFIGKALQFAGQGSDGRAYYVFTIAGRRLQPGGAVQVETLDQAHPQAVAPTGADLTEYNELANGLKVTRMMTANGGTELSIIGFTDGLGKAAGNGANLLGSQNISLVGVAGSSINQPSASGVARVGTISESSKAVVSNGVKICFKSGLGNQYGAIFIGEGGKQLSTRLVLDGKIGVGDLTGCPA